VIFTDLEIWSCNFWEREERKVTTPGMGFRSYNLLIRNRSFVASVSARVLSRHTKKMMGFEFHQVDYIPGS
jgi:hypothetical protein